MPILTKLPTTLHLTGEQWHALRERMTDDEREALDGLEKQRSNAEELLGAWTNPVLGTSPADSSYERARIALESAQLELDVFVRRKCEEHGI
jgi:hypothetical protein